MYQKPAVQKFGSFRELTQYGQSGSDDLLAYIGIGDGCRQDGGILTGCWDQPSAS